MNIDYEAIEKDIRTSGGWAISLHAIKAIIEAYEAQKKAPEWVPLDLATVKQEQEVRCTVATIAGRFVSKYLDGFVVAAEHGYHLYSRAEDWLMRAPRPKTVHVRVFKMPDGEYVSTAGRFFDGYQVVGEGDIEVPE